MLEVKREYNPEVKVMGYITPGIENSDLWDNNTDKMNKAILADFYQAVEWLLRQGYEEYKEIQSNTINPAQQNAFTPLREYRVKRNGHYKTVKIYHRFFGGCYIEETEL